MVACSAPIRCMNIEANNKHNSPKTGGRMEENYEINRNRKSYCIGL